MFEILKMNAKIKNVIALRLILILWSHMNSFEFEYTSFFDLFVVRFSITDYVK